MRCPRAADVQPEALAGAGLAKALAGLLAGFTVATIGGLVVSLAFGLFGFRESIHAAYVVQSLVIEAITLLALLAWTILTASRA